MCAQTPPLSRGSLWSSSAPQSGVEPLGESCLSVVQEREVGLCVCILLFANPLYATRRAMAAAGLPHMTYSCPQLQRVKTGHPDLPLPYYHPAKQKKKE